jgi:hypothetical protein
MSEGAGTVAVREYGQFLDGRWESPATTATGPWSIEDLTYLQWVSAQSGRRHFPI